MPALKAASAAQGKQPFAFLSVPPTSRQLHMNPAANMSRWSVGTSIMEEDDESQDAKSTTASKGFMAGQLDKLKRLGGTTLRRRKLLIRGIPPTNTAALDSVKQWCHVRALIAKRSALSDDDPQNFGELREISQHRSGDIHVDFMKSASVEAVRACFPSIAASS